MTESEYLSVFSTIAEVTATVVSVSAAVMSFAMQKYQTFFTNLTDPFIKAEGRDGGKTALSIYMGEDDIATRTLWIERFRLDSTLHTSLLRSHQALHSLGYVQRRCR